MRNRILALASTAALVPVLALGTAPAWAGGNGNGNGNGGGNDPAGNNGTVKIAEIDDVATPSNDPHVSCTFAVEWDGFDQGAYYSDVTFESQAPTADASIAVSGSTHVFIGADAAGGATDLDAREVYTLTFTGTPAHQGFHVKMTTENGGSHGADRKSKVFWVEPCTPAGDGGSGGSGGGDPVAEDPDVTPLPLVPWSWDWHYAAPTCDALTVDYPANIPDGQSNDVNVRFASDSGAFTLNFHNNQGTWSGRTAFTFANHAQWPSALTGYTVEWVQVGGTNYHWQGSVGCGDEAPAAPAPGTTTPAPAAPAPAAPAPATAAPAQVVGFTSGAVQVRRGSAPQAVVVAVTDTEADAVQVQQLKPTGWKAAGTATISSEGTAKISFPRLTKRGTYKFRVVVDSTRTKPMVVKVR